MVCWIFVLFQFYCCFCWIISTASYCIPFFFLIVIHSDRVVGLLLFEFILYTFFFSVCENGEANSNSHYCDGCFCECVCLSCIFTQAICTSSEYIFNVCKAIIIAFELVMQIINNNKEFDFRNVVNKNDGYEWEQGNFVLLKVNDMNAVATNNDRNTQYWWQPHNTRSFAHTISCNPFVWIVDLVNFIFHTFIEKVTPSR